MKHFPSAAARAVTGRAATAAFTTVIAGAITLTAIATPVHAQTGHELGVDTMNFDRHVRPQDDLFRFVNGGWIAHTEIPADASSWGAFNELREKSRTALHGLLENAAASNAPAGSEKRKVGDLYASYMDSARVEALGLKPLQGELNWISGLKSDTQLPAAFAHLARLGVQGPFGVGVGADQKASSVNIVSLNQSGIGMPDRDYYLAPDAKMSAVRDAYHAYITRLFTLAKQPDPEGSATRIMTLETSIAKAQWDRAHNRDRNATYNRMTVAQLAAMTPSYDWHSYLTAAGLGAAKDIVVRQPSYVTAANDIIAGTPIATWREYMTFKLLDSYASQLPSAFQDARFEFRGKTLSGAQVQTVRWKRGVDEVERILGEPAGKLYVAANFKPEAKARMDAMVNNLRKAYQVGIDSLTWMSPETKAQAKAKLAKFTVKIGYPDHYRDYSALVIKRNDLLGNAMRSAEFQYNDMSSRLGQPVERWRWGMTPQTVNAYYNATNNEIVFPAAILQPPFFDVNADDAVNYGAIGAVIGHEIGHGFDDQGRKSDGDGNLRDWWTAGDATAFDARTTKLGAQYDAIVPIDSIHINGKLTMGENIGDLSGLAQAYRAYHISLGGKPAPVIDGFTGDQRFFLGFAQIWRTKYRDAALRQQLLSDPHSPGMYRAFVPLVNNDAFDAAFNVQPGDRMYLAPVDRVKIW
ncbi:MAG: M13 family metallopeptidase [Gemmatimonadota bacterium]|nr:M13 family metallopeptidase [Gemmatimonadota bacterium]